LQDRYLVSIPIKTVNRATIEQMKGFGLVNGLRLGNVLRVRVEGTTIIEGKAGSSGTSTYLDIEVSADNRKDAVEQAFSLSQLFVQLMVLVHQAEFEFDISFMGIQATKLSPTGALEPSTYFGQQTDILSFQDVVPVWERVITMKEQGSELWKVLKIALEWLYFGAIANEERSIFLAYRIALEVLLRSIEGNENSTTVFNKYLDKKKHRLLVKAVRAVFTLYIDDAKALERLMQRLEGTLAESDSERWARILNNVGVSVSSKELDDLGIARGSVVHSGVGNEKMSTTRVREIVIAYIYALLGIGKH
jgi:hypothetical protein